VVRTYSAVNGTTAALACPSASRGAHPRQPLILGRTFEDGARGWRARTGSGATGQEAVWERRRRKATEGRTRCVQGFVFDLLALDGADLRGRPRPERRHPRRGSSSTRMRSPSSRRFSFAAASSDPRNVHRCGQLRETSTPRATSTRCGPVPGSGPSTWSARRSGGAPRRDAHFRAMASMNPGAGGAAVLSKTRAWCRWWMRPLRSCNTTVWTSVQRGNLPRTSKRRFIPRAPW